MSGKVILGDETMEVDMVNGYVVTVDGSTVWFEVLRAAETYLAVSGGTLHKAAVTLGEEITAAAPADLERTPEGLFLERTAEGHRDYLRLVQGGKR